MKKKKSDKTFKTRFTPEQQKSLHGVAEEFEKLCGQPPRNIILPDGEKIRYESPEEKQS